MGEEHDDAFEDEDLDDEAPSAARRGFLGAIVASAISGASVAFAGRRRSAGKVTLRPPGALPPGEFEDACVRCFRCSNACPNQCIDFHGIGAGLDQLFTPYIHARSRGCILCGECSDACPTGALKPFHISDEGWLASVDMGTARVNEDLCYSYHGRTCGACYRACPLAGQAMTIGLYETPIVHEEACVGCGLCEQACLHLPQAIRVVPASARSGPAPTRLDDSEREG